MKYLYFLLLPFLFFGCKSSCADKDSCKNDSKCQCWCSQKCGWRDKTSKDKPVYIETDSNGKYCYCNQWDYDHYEGNCIRGEHVKEPGME